MARKIYKPEEIVTLPRQVEVAVANGKMTPQAVGWCRSGMLRKRRTTALNSFAP